MIAVSAPMSLTGPALQSEEALRPGSAFRRACGTPELNCADEPECEENRGDEECPAGAEREHGMEQEMTLERTTVSPVMWSLEMGFNQGEVVSGETRTLYVSGQTSMSQDGWPEQDGDIAAQLALSVDNFEAVLTAAGMSLANLVRLNVYTNDVDALFPHYGELPGRLGAAGVSPTTSMLGVSCLAIPGQLVELEGTAVA